MKKKTAVNTKSVDSAQAGPLARSDDAVMIAYHRRKLYTISASDPVADFFGIQLLGQLGGPVVPLSRLRTVTEVFTTLITLLRKTIMTTGSVEPSTLFDVNFNSIKSMLEKMHKRLTILVGTTTRHDNVPPAQPIPTPSRDSHMTL
uniref:Uncharacterized protein n=1 Tax=Peronospora matthiolae TaxID=2874970 RepID=A0AAV1U8E2_9STRA